MSENTDRDLKAEAELIKSALTEKPQSNSKPDDAKDSTSQRTNISFTSLSESAIPGFSMRKLLGTRLQVTYVPDFYYIIELTQRLFKQAKSNKALKPIDNLNMHSFTLYIAHSLMYVFLRALEDTNTPSVDLSTILKIYEKGGFSSCQVPAICSNWIDAIGYHQDASSKRQFVPYLPQIATGAIFNGGFFSANVGHLIPNIYCLLSITRASATRDTGLQILNAAATQNMSGYFGLAVTTNNLANSTSCRANALRIPGCKNIGIPCNDIELLNVIDITLNTNFTDPMQNLLKATPAMLLQLKTSVQPLFLEIDYINLTHSSPTGNSLLTVPIISEPNQAIYVPEVNIAAVVGPPSVAVMHVHSEHDHSSRVKSRYEIINGNADYAYQTPVVRVVTADEAVILNNFTFNDPQHTWYSLENEFQSNIVTMAEGRSYFKRKD